MGRLFLIAGIAVVASSGSALAKPDQAKNGKSERSVEKKGVGYGAGGCPPGLRRQNPECIPPGQRKKLFEVGQRVPSGYRGLMRYNSLPSELRNQYGGTLDPRGRYIYDQQYLYRVDPTTMIVRQVLRGVIGN